MPPASRNQRDPTAGDTPASIPATSLEAPRAIASQNACRCSRRATGGRPGDRIGGLPVAAAAAFVVPCTHLRLEVLRRPLDSAYGASTCMNACDGFHPIRPVPAGGTGERLDHDDILAVVAG